MKYCCTSNDAIKKSKLQKKFNEIVILPKKYRFSKKITDFFQKK